MFAKQPPWDLPWFNQPARILPMSRGGFLTVVTDGLSESALNQKTREWFYLFLCVVRCGAVQCNVVRGLNPEGQVENGMGPEVGIEWKHSRVLVPQCGIIVRIDGWIDESAH